MPWRRPRPAGPAPVTGAAMRSLDHLSVDLEDEPRRRRVEIRDGDREFHVRGLRAAGVKNIVAERLRLLELRQSIVAAGSIEPPAPGPLASRPCRPACPGDPCEELVEQAVIAEDGAEVVQLNIRLRRGRERIPAGDDVPARVQDLLRRTAASRSCRSATVMTFSAAGLGDVERHRAERVGKDALPAGATPGAATFELRPRPKEALDVLLAHVIPERVELLREPPAACDDPIDLRLAGFAGQQLADPLEVTLSPCARFRHRRQTHGGLHRFQRVRRAGQALLRLSKHPSQVAWQARRASARRLGRGRPIADDSQDAAQRSSSATSGLRAPLGLRNRARQSRIRRSSTTASHARM